MIFYGIFKKYISGLLNDRNTSIHNQLLSEDEGMESIEVGEFLIKDAEKIKQVPEIKKILLDGKEEPEKIFNILKSMVLKDIYNHKKEDVYKSSERKVLKIIYSKPFPFNLLNLIFFNFILKTTRKMIMIYFFFNIMRYFLIFMGLQ